MSNIDRQLSELQEIARNYQEELRRLKLAAQGGESVQVLNNRLSAALCFLNESMPRIIKIQNQINHAKNNYDSDDLRRNPNQSNGAEVVGGEQT